MSNFRLLLAEAALKGVTEAQARIFGHLIGEKVAAWYPYDIKRDDSLVMACEEKARLSKLEMQKRHGKAAPKKGQGRRALKRNK
ncbi:hypothetical protein MKX01_006648 [Papaver californicum]|nr:hypothetical protein MKX01_006648 [Papaver californicum]